MLGHSGLGSNALGELPDSAAAFALAAGAGSLTLTGVDAGLAAQRLVAAAVGAFTFTGVAASVVAVRTATAGTGTFTVSGNAAAITATRTLTASAAYQQEDGAFGFGALGEFAFGQAGTETQISFELRFNPADVAYARVPLAAGTGVFAISDGGTEIYRLLGINAKTPAAVVVTFNAAGLVHVKSLAASTGTFSTGAAVVDFARARRGLRVNSGGGSRGLLASAGGGGRGLRIRA